MKDLKGISMVWLSKTDLTNLNAGEGESNLVDIKKFKKEGVEYPYVSGQAMRFYLREAIRRNLNGEEFMCIPNDRGETCGDIKKCINCDLFGFMLPEKQKGATKRVSPVKVSPAIGLFPFDENTTLDFLTRRKFKEKEEKQEGDIVNVEIGTNIYKCGIAVDIQRVGGEEVDQKKKTIKLNYKIEENERSERIKKLIESLKYIADYSKQARLLTDFTPDIICVAFQNKYSHRLQKLFEFVNTEGEIERKINTNRLSEILMDVKEYSDNILFGMISGIIENEEDVREIFKKAGIEIKTPKEVIEQSLTLLK